MEIEEDKRRYLEVLSSISFYLLISSSIFFYLLLSSSNLT